MKLPSWIVWFRPFPEWLCRRPLLLVIAALLLAIIWGCVGVEYGVPNLFWHKDPMTQFFAGVGAVWLLGQLCYISYLLDTKPGDTRAGWMEGRSMWWYLTVTWIPLLLLILIRVVVPAYGDDLYSRTYNDVVHWPLVAGVVVGFLIAAGLIFLLDHVQKRFVSLLLLRILPYRQKLPEELKAAVDHRKTFLVPKGLRDKVPIEVQRNAIQATFFGLLVLAYLAIALSPLASVVFPALALCILLGIIAAIYGFMLLRVPGAVYPVVILMVLLALLCSIGPDKHRFEGLEEYYANKEPFDDDSYLLRQLDDCGLLDNTEALNAWAQYQMNHVTNPQELPPLVVIAASGGGIRSALWTAVVLTKLEEQIPGFIYRVRLITGASGGMLGTAYFTSLFDELKQWDEANHFHAGKTKDEKLLAARRQKLHEVMDTERMKKGGLREAAQYAVLRDVPRLYWPTPYYQDRGWALEEAWRTNLSPTLGRPVRDLQEGERQGWRPSLVFSPVLVEDGRRLLISNLDLNHLVENIGSQYYLENQKPECDVKYSISAVEFFRLFPKADKTFRLSTAVRMSASFPYISPVAALPTVPARRVVDAGYYDNYGVNLAAEWIYANRSWLQKNTSGVILIQVRDQQSNRNHLSLGQEEKPPSHRNFDNPSSEERKLLGRIGLGKRDDEAQTRTWLDRGAEGVTTPIEGALSALQASMSFRNDELLQILTHVLNGPEDGTGGCSFFTTFLIQCPEKAALTWYLTDQEFDIISRGVDGQVPSAVAGLVQPDAETSILIQKNKKQVKGVEKLVAPK